jgi:tellurite methyltransferase
MRESTDEAYWAQYYETGVAPDEPSLFAQYVLGKYVHPGDSMIEFGCGNGRDARFFAANGIDVVAVDLCAPEIKELVEKNGTRPNLHYKIGDFTELEASEKSFDVVYSRFTLHSVNAEGQERALRWSQENLLKLGRLCIETRGQKNEIYKLGDSVEGEKDAFIYNNHYRRFVDFNEFKTEITETGLKIIEGSEQTGFAPFEDTDYHFIRVIAQK